MSSTAQLTLPQRLDLTSATELTRALLDKSGGDLALDASETRHIGTPGLQVLLSARKTWEAAGDDLVLMNVTPALEGQLAQFGLSPIDLQTGFGALPEAEPNQTEE